MTPHIEHAGTSPWIVIDMPGDNDGLGPGEILIPLEAVAVEAELLGYEDMSESLQAIIHKLTHETESPADPKTGHNVWTDPYTLLAAREQAREDAAREVQCHTGHTEHEVQVAAAQMAHRAVHEPIDGGECAMDRCRRAARDEMALPEPSKKCGATSRGEAPQVLNPATETGSVFTPEALEYLGKVRSQFLHSLVGSDDDNPIGDTTPPPEPENPILSADELMQKFGGTT